MTFWDRMAKRFDTPPPTPEEDEAVRRLLPYLRPDAAVLEVGCAAGATAEALGARVGSWHGIDISAEMVRRARARGIPNATFRAGTLADADLPDGALDVVVAFNVLHFMELPRDLDHIVRLLRPGGVLAAQTPCLGDLHPMARGLLPLVATVLRVPDLKRLRGADLRDAISARFDVVEADLGRPSRTWIVARRA